MTRVRISRLSLALLLAITACGRDEAPVAAPAAASARQGTEAADHRADSSPQPGAAPAVAPWQPAVPVIPAADVGKTLRQARQSLALGQIERGSGPGPGALELYLAVLAVAPGHAEATQGLQDTLDALLEQGRIAMRTGDFGNAQRIDAIAKALQPGHPDLATYRENLAAAHRAQALVEQADAMARRGKLVAPEGRSALDLYRRARLAAPDFQPVAAGMDRWHQVALQQAWKAASDEDYAGADQRLAEARLWLPQSPQNEVMALRVVELRQALTDALLQQGNSAVDKLDLQQAERSLEHAQRVAAQASGVDALRERIRLARHYGPYKPLQVFSEPLVVGGNGPELVVIPYGRFQMGAPADDVQRGASEGPVHEVVFERGFALATAETTVAEFRRFVAASGYRTLAERRGQSTIYDEKGGQMSVRQRVDWRHDQGGRNARPDQPVLHVAFEDAQAYVDWLSRQTGQRYRLPSEAEFEYALRAGSAKTYAWGMYGPTHLVGNLAGEGDQTDSGRRWGNAVPGYRDGYWGPAPVRSFPAEAYGTFDLVGNVSEWTLDCWHDSYQRAPADGSAWVNPGCPQRVVRGASWASSLGQARSAFRQAMAADSSGARVGFRVVREL